MQIIKRIKADKAGRILLSKFFAEMPEWVVVTFDTDTKNLYFTETNSNDPLGYKVDSKNRLYLPTWLREEVGEGFIICPEGIEKRYLIPSKFFAD